MHMSDKARYTCDFKLECTRVQSNSKLQIKYAIITTCICHNKLKPGGDGRRKERMSTEKFHCKSN